MGIDELIEKYKRIFDNSKPDMLAGPFSRGEDAGSGRVSHEIVEDLKQLKSSLPTQQDKVVVPEFVSEWIEYAKKKGHTLFESVRPFELYGVDYLRVGKWIKENEDIYARAWLDDYTVEKEPLFKMPVPCMRNTLHYCLKDNGEISFRQGNAYKFNQDQIDKYFPEIKDMAVPVKEEAE